MIAVVKPSWYILSYKVLDDEAEARTGGRRWRRTKFKDATCPQKALHAPSGVTSIRAFRVCLSLWIRGAHAEPPTENKKVGMDQDCYRKH